MSFILNRVSSVIPIGGIATLTGNAGGAVGPTVGNIDIVGSGGVTVTGNPGTSTLTITGDGLGVTTITGDTGGALTGSNITFTGGTSGAVFSGAVTTETLSFDYLSLPTTTATDGQILINGGTVFHTFGGTNTFVGAGSGNLTLTGFSSVGVGSSSLGSVTSGAFNVALGFLASNGITTGSNNISMGSGSLMAVTTTGNNTALGNQSLQNIVTGADNIAIGHLSGDALTTNDSDNILIGSVGVVGDNGTIRIGTNATHTSVFVAGIEGVDVGNVAEVVTIDNNELGSAVITAGAGISVTPTANVITIAATGMGAFAWSVITIDQTAVVNNGYICNKAGTLVLGLPATAAIGDIIRVTGINTALGWQITQAANQQIFFGASSTTLGAAGTITSSATRDSLEIVCVVAGASTVWNVISSIGNPTLA
jgi:hypothetical protein